jgi:hypothetical protein
MENQIRKISKSKRSSLQIHFVVNKNQTITSLQVLEVHERDALQLERNLQWMINMKIPYPSSCGYDIVMKLDFSGLS